MLKGTRQSTGYRNDIKLYANKIDQYPIVHEMTHTLLGYGENFGSTRGFFTQEGYAVYMESEYGESTLMNYGFSTHEIVKLLMNKDKNLPLNKLITQGFDTSYFRPVMNDPGDNALQWMSYMHAGSFVTYLIEKYGREDFEKVYNQANLPKKLNEVYGKSEQELEKEWLTYIENTSEITAEEKEMVDNLDNLNAIINSIDEDLFQR
ncbi:hypothetical protein VBD025_12800 [Virgibacillus flavescens]|uniref:hypothetical protein n=1 Tax=Virgibacillus flavescens TaxID=1611422 RepID=UPI003D3572B8